MITIPPTALATVVLVFGFGMLFLSFLFGGLSREAVDGMSGLFVFLLLLFFWRGKTWIWDFVVFHGVIWFALGGVQSRVLFLYLVEHTLIVSDSMLGRWEVIIWFEGGPVYGRFLDWGGV
jgi:hypothetical protein